MSLTRKQFRDMLINQMSGGRGFASLTAGQKEALSRDVANAYPVAGTQKTTSTPTTSTTPIESASIIQNRANRLEAEQKAREKEARRQNAIRNFQQFQQTNPTPDMLANFLATQIPTEFRRDISVMAGLAPTGGTFFTPSGFQIDIDTQNQIRGTRTTEDEALDEILANPNLDQDMKDMLRFMFDVQQTFNTDQADRLLEGLEFAKGQADPIFKAKIALARDALQRGFVSEDQTLEYKEQQLANTLSDLKKDASASKEFLDFEQAQQLKNLEKNLEVNLERTRQGLAERGKTVSSVRSRAEKLLTEEKEGLVQSTERKFGFEARKLRTGLERGKRDTLLDLVRLKELTSEGKLDLFRKAEERLGTANLPQLGGFTPLGEQVGTYAQQRAKDITGTLSNFIF